MKKIDCKVMGIVNVTPDSFSDGGKYFAPEEAVKRACNLIREGADIIDLGGESTRPGAERLDWQSEWARLEPVIKNLIAFLSSPRQKLRRVPISIDTYHPETAQKAIELGADIINCVYEEPISEMCRVIKNSNKSIELVMPAKSYLKADIFALDKSQVYIDPMIGFGTTREEDLELLRSIKDLSLKARVLVGASRKRIVKKLTGEKNLGKNLGGNIAIALWAALSGASAVRVHDVFETVQAIKTATIIVDESCILEE